MTNVSHPTAESLLAHRAWVRSLARALTQDPHDADDLEQQTWLVALDRRRDEAALRGLAGARGGRG